MRCIVLLGLASVILICGCVSIPAVSVTDQISVDELAQHVDFLTQRPLKGRAAGSWESKHVRNYLSQRLQTYGCVPWADNPSFELDFGFGKNIIGILPGSDPQLSKEIVLISAHYDHLPSKWFSYYPGACDNAASVAVLLEIAEKVSRMEYRPRRTLCFAFFDAEEKMCLGSFAFTCRNDFDDSKIVAAINMDILGRDLLDVVDKSLIVTGTENYVRIQTAVSAACTQNKLKFIPLELDLIGPVGDHIAFISGQRPVLFFTCGINKDYHQPTDTADKLNISKLKQESAVIEQTLLALANADNTLLAQSPSPVTREQIDSFSYILDRFKENQDFFKLEPNDIQMLNNMIVKTKQIDPNTVVRAELLDLEYQTLGDLIKLLKYYDKRLSQFSEAFVSMSELYAINPQGLTEAYRDIIQHYLTHKPSLFNKNDYTYCGNLPIIENSWGLTKINDDEYFFGFVDVEITGKIKVNVLTGISFEASINHKLTACKGSLPGIIDIAFSGKPSDPNECHGVIWGYFGSAEQKPKADSKYNLAQRKKSLWKALFTTIEKDFPEEMPALQFQPYRDPNTLTENFITESEPNLNAWSIFLTPHDVMKPQKQDKAKQQQQSIQTLKDASKHIEDRTDALASLIHLKTADSLTAIVDVMDDKTLYATKPTLMFENDYPLRYHPFVSKVFKQKQEKGKKYKDKTLGQIACEKLKEVTKKDFSTDKEAWKRWIKKHYPNKP